MPFETSILKSVKQKLMLTPEDTSFDQTVIEHINSAFSDLNDLGIGPDDGFVIEDDSTSWGDFLDNVPQLNRAKKFIFLKVRLVFDPPSTSYVLTSLENQLKECEWRLSTSREKTEWTDPDPDPIVVE